MNPKREAGRALTVPLLAWYRDHRRLLPWREGRDPYRVWISEIMLQQTTVRAVTPYFERFVRRFPTIETLAAARPGEVLALWSGLGYYRRARHLHETARLLVKERRGLFPKRFEEAKSLPGIGRYTAGAILSIAYDVPLPAVDGNAARVLTRLFLLRALRARTLEKRLWVLAGDLVARSSSPGDFNQALMELGATICKPVGPSCTDCPLKHRCGARRAGLQEKIPPLRRPSRRAVAVRLDLALVSRGPFLLMRRRTDRALMHGLWEFPTVPSGSAGGDLRLSLDRSLATIRHSITYRRLELRVRPARLLSEPPPGLYRWVRVADLHRLPTSSIVRKVVDVLRRHSDRSTSSARQTGASRFDRPAGLC